MTEANVVVAFRHRPTQRHPRYLLDAVYAAGSLAVAADDRATKLVAGLLSAMGFLVVERIGADGRAYPIGRGEMRAAMAAPWRLRRPAGPGDAGPMDAAPSRGV